MCSEHFVNARGRTLRPDELPTVKLPVLSTKVFSAPPRKSIIRHKLPEKTRSEVPAHYGDASVNTELSGAEIELLEDQLRGSKESARNLEEQCADLKEKQHFHLKNISHDDNSLKFYTGFGAFSALMVCINFLGPAVNNLNYWRSSGDVNGTSKSNKSRKRTLSPLQ